MSIPIAMTTFNRPEYLRRTLKSLNRSYANLSNLIIVDDKSTNKEQLDLLENIRNKYDIYVNDYNLGTMKNTVQAITLAYEKSDSEYIVYCQDDIIFSKNWLYDGLKLMEYMPKDKKIAYINLCDRNSKESISQIGYRIINIGHNGALCWIISRIFWKEYLEKIGNDNGVEFFGKNQQRKEYLKKHVCDKKITEYARGLGWKVANVTGASLVNHIGNKSSLHSNDMSMWSSKNFIGEG